MTSKTFSGGPTWAGVSCVPLRGCAPRCLERAVAGHSLTGALLLGRDQITTQTQDVVVVFLKRW